MKYLLLCLGLCLACASLHAESSLVSRSSVATNGASPQQLWVHAQGKASRSFPKGGGYLTTKVADALLEKAVLWDDTTCRLVVKPRVAQPSYCSGAVYLHVLHSLCLWDASLGKRAISAPAWQAMAPRGQKDGEGVWGWANANGPGFAYLVHTLGAGHNFSRPEAARPGDVLKLWWTKEIGGRERGHLVIYLGHDEKQVHFWSSNEAGEGAVAGFGRKSAPWSRVKHMLFTRITRPEAFNKAPRISRSSWLADDMLRRDVSMDEVRRRCGVHP